MTECNDAICMYVVWAIQTRWIMYDLNVPESCYIAKNIGHVLECCLADLCEARPPDPIEYIARWIYKHRENEVRRREVSNQHTLSI